MSDKRRDVLAIALAITAVFGELFVLATQGHLSLIGWIGLLCGIGTLLAYSLLGVIE
mgnify:CR=1 FL=1